MKYFSEEEIIAQGWANAAQLHRMENKAINVRLCRDCEYFEHDHPTIETDGDFGYCTYKTNFIVFDDEPIHWYFTNETSFCNEEDLK